MGLPTAIVGAGISGVSAARRLKDFGHEPAQGHTYVVHATPEWIRAKLELSPDDVVAVLSAALSRELNQAIQPMYAAAHRWLYALVEQPLGRDFIWDQAAVPGGCGDWCIGARIEDAFMSGLKLGDAIHADFCS